MRTFRVVTDRAEYTVEADDFYVQSEGNQSVVIFQNTYRKVIHPDDRGSFGRDGGMTYERTRNVQAFSNIVSVQEIPSFEDDEEQV